MPYCRQHHCAPGVNLYTVERPSTHSTLPSSHVLLVQIVTPAGNIVTLWTLISRSNRDHIPGEMVLKRKTCLEQICPCMNDEGFMTFLSCHQNPLGRSLWSSHGWNQWRNSTRRALGACWCSSKINHVQWRAVRTQQ